MKRIALVLAAASALCVAGCASKPVYLGRTLNRVLVLPPFNDTTKLDAYTEMWGHVEHQAISRGYPIVPRSEVEAYYRSKNFNAPEEIEQIPIGKVCEDLKADGVLYTRIDQWGVSSSIIYTWLGVKLGASFYTSKNEDLWQGAGEAGESKVALDRQGAAESALLLVKDAGRHAGAAAANTFRTMPLNGGEPIGDNVGPDKVGPDRK